MGDNTVLVPDPLAAMEGLTDDDILRFTQGTRKNFVNHLLKGGFPSDPKDQKILLTTLTDMDKVALGNKRIGAADKQSAADILVAKAIATISGQFVDTDPFVKDGVRELPAIDMDQLPPADPVPGETEVGLSDESYAAIMAKFDD